MTKHDSIASRLIERRAKLGYTQDTLAKLAGIAPAQISRYEAGVNKPRANIIAKLADALAVSYNWLAYGDDSEFKDELGEIPHSIEAVFEPEYFESIEIIDAESSLDMIDDDSIAARIIERRAILGLSQNSLAQQSNVAPAQISRYESGKRKPSPQVIKRIADALGVPFDWLAYGNTTEFENVKDELEGISYSIDLPPDLADMVHKEAARLGITPAEFANHLIELGASVLSHKIAIGEKMGKKK